MRKNKKTATVVRAYRFPASITIPAGKCPVALTDTDNETVREWILALLEVKPEGHGYEPAAFKYYSRQFYEVLKEDYRIVCSHIDSLLKGKTLFSKKDVNF